MSTDNTKSSASPKPKASFKPHHDEPYKKYSIYRRKWNGTEKYMGNMIATNDELALAKAQENFGATIEPGSTLFVKQRFKCRRSPLLAKQAAELHKQIKALSDMHKGYYRAAECYFALAQEPPDQPSGELSLFSSYLQDCMFDALRQAEYLMRNLVEFQN